MRSHILHISSLQKVSFSAFLSAPSSLVPFASVLALGGKVWSLLFLLLPEMLAGLCACCIFTREF